ncbi:MAG: hypothetical protein M3Y72_20150 [Acidobacteriota bacterium]|nr:hypothetical protein [Acidobacteriota bacterium]
MAANKLLQKLNTGSALQQQITQIAKALQPAIPTITAGQVVLSSAAPDLADKNMQMAYPRVCIYSSNSKNTQIEKFRSFSGSVSLVAEIWASANLVNQTDEWIHFYVEAVAEILQLNSGDWGDGMFYSGAYEVQFQPPKAGGLGFVQSAKLTFSLNVSVG